MRAKRIAVFRFDAESTPGKNLGGSKLRRVGIPSGMAIRSVQFNSSHA